jgi:hypothetical protein
MLLMFHEMSKWFFCHLTSTVYGYISVYNEDMVHTLNRLVHEFACTICTNILKMTPVSCTDVVEKKSLHFLHIFIGFCKYVHI